MSDDKTHNAEAELALAAIIGDGRHTDAWTRIAEIIGSPLAFYGKVPRAMAIAAAELTANGDPVNSPTIAEWLGKRTWTEYTEHCRELEQGPRPFRGKTEADFANSALANLGGFPEIAKVGGQLAPIRNLKRHALTVAEHYRQRRALEVMRKAEAALLTPGGAHKAPDLIAQAVEGLARIQSAEGASSSLSDGVSAALTRHDELQSGKVARTVASWGLPSLDERAPLDAGALWTLSARTGSGKTSLLLHAIEATARVHGPGSVGMVSREMGVRELAEIYIARHLRTSRQAVRYGRLDRGQRDQADQIAAEVAKWSPEIRDGFTCTSADACAWARSRKIATGGRLALLCVDHVGILSKEHPKQTDYDKVTEAMHRLKATARTLDIAVLVLCQLSRESDDKRKRKSPEPALSDLKGSGAVEEDSDGVLFLYRPETQTPGSGIEVVANVAKNRGGALSKTTLTFHPAEGQRFADPQGTQTATDTNPAADTPNPAPRHERLARAGTEQDEPPW